jgi:hypothetical protein
MNVFEGIQANQKFKKGLYVERQAKLSDVERKEIVFFLFVFIQ